VVEENNQMKCPTCKTVELAATELEPGLRAVNCGGCAGTFIPFDRYLGWQEATGSELWAGFSDALRAIRGSAGASVAAENAAPCLCPACGRFMSRYRVSVDLPFYLDRCGGCASFWLSKGEWDILKLRAVHNRIHMVPSDTWQQHIRQADGRRQQEQRYKMVLGDDAYSTAREFKQWMSKHPKHQVVFAYLEDREAA
jgi:Zn-finger nucleic acid-binding protein